MPRENHCTQEDAPCAGLLASLLFAIVALACLLNAAMAGRMDADQANALKAPLAVLAEKQAQSQARVGEELAIGAQALATAAKQTDRADWNGLVLAFEKAYGAKATLSDREAKTTSSDWFTLRVHRSVAADHGTIRADVAAPALGVLEFHPEGRRPGFMVAMAALIVGLSALVLAYPMRMRLPIALCFATLAAGWACMIVMDLASNSHGASIRALEKESIALADNRISPLRESWLKFQAGLPVWKAERADAAFKTLESAAERGDMSAVLIIDKNGKIEHASGGPTGWAGSSTAPVAAIEALKTGTLARSPAPCGFIEFICDSVAAPMANGKVLVAVFPPSISDFRSSTIKPPAYPWKAATLMCLAIGALLSFAAWNAARRSQAGL